MTINNRVYQAVQSQQEVVETRQDFYSLLQYVQDRRLLLEIEEAFCSAIAATIDASVRVGIECSSGPAWLSREA